MVDLEMRSAFRSGTLGLAEGSIQTVSEGTCCVQTTGSRPRVYVTADGRGVVGHAGTRLLADIADVTGLTGGFSDALRVVGRRAGGHDPGRVATDVAGLARLRGARAAARELAWAQLVDTRGRLPASMAAGREVPGLVLDLDASIVVTHSEKEQATPTWKKTFGYHPLFCFCDNTREALAGILRPGRAGSNTAADHIAVLDAALAQFPDAHRYGIDLLIRADTAGCTPGVPGPHPRPARTGDGHVLLGRGPGHRGGPRRDPRGHRLDPCTGRRRRTCATARKSSRSPTSSPPAVLARSRPARG